MDYGHMQSIILAHEAGKQIEYRYRGQTRPIGWLSMESVHGAFNFDGFQYRIKPEPPKPREFFIRVTKVEKLSNDRCNLAYRSKEQAEECGESLAECVHVREVLP